jgi:hypothetical protein
MLLMQLKTSEVEKNLAWEAQQEVKKQQSNADAANSLLLGMGGVPAGLGSCCLQVRFKGVLGGKRKNIHGRMIFVFKE